MRKGMWLAGLLTLCLGAPAWCGGSSDSPLGKPVRFLSRNEVIALALENRAAELGVGSDPFHCTVRWLSRDGAVKLTSCEPSRAETERRLNQILLNVETAYWNLYGSYWTLHSREQGLRHALEAWCLEFQRYWMGKVGVADLAEARGQYELFRAQRLTAISQLLDNDRQLRELLGMKSEDGTRLVPSDAPMIEEVEPSWPAALEEALKRRPEVQTARRDLTISKCRLGIAKALCAAVRIACPGAIRGEGAGCGNAFRNLPSGWQDWEVGTRLCTPSRVANGPCRQEQLQVARSYLGLQDQELKTERFLALQYRRIIENYQQIRAQRAQREAFALQVRLRRRAFRAGRGTLDLLLEAQRFWTDALANEYQSIVAYNNALAAFDFARGHSQDRHHLVAGMDSSDRDRSEEAEEPPSRDSSLTLPGLWETTPPVKKVPILPEIDVKECEPLIEQTIDEVLPAPRDAEKGSAPKPAK